MLLIIKTVYTYTLRRTDVSLRKALTIHFQAPCFFAMAALLFWFDGLSCIKRRLLKVLDWTGVVALLKLREKVNVIVTIAFMELKLSL
jgi:hypothetical protein